MTWDTEARMREDRQAGSRQEAIQSVKRGSQARRKREHMLTKTRTSMLIAATTGGLSAREEHQVLTDKTPGRRLLSRSAVTALAAGALLSSSLAATPAGAEEPPTPKQTVGSRTTAPPRGASGTFVFPRPHSMARKVAKPRRRDTANRHGTKVLAHTADATYCNSQGCFRRLTTFHWQSYPQLNQYGNHAFGWQVFNLTSETGYETNWKYWYAWTGTMWKSYARNVYTPTYACWIRGGDANCPA